MTTRIDRRTLAAGLALGGLAPLSRALAAPAGPACIVSTWDFGVAANAAGMAIKRRGGSLLDIVEAAARQPEADPANHYVGLGGYPDRDGRVTLDAVIMDDAGHVGAVAALENTVHAISVARRVMEKTPHVLLVGDGATAFARAQGFPYQKLPTPEALAAWRAWLKTSRYQPQRNVENSAPSGKPGGPDNHDTIGILACDASGHLAGACTTSGMAWKMHGRVGDSPLVGCGLYVEPGVGAATSSGVGEEVIRIAGSARVVSSMRGGMSPGDACAEAVRHIVKLRGEAVRQEQVGFLALSPRGETGAFALAPGFTYAVTDATGRTEVRKAAALFPS